MIGYVPLGTDKFEAALKFYDALFSSVGATGPKNSDDGQYRCRAAYRRRHSLRRQNRMSGKLEVCGQTRPLPGDPQ